MFNQPSYLSTRLQDTVLSLPQSLLAGIGQIFFQAAPLTGAALLLCLYLSRPVLVFGCMLGVIAATATACAAGFPREQRQQGLYGFNAALSGVGLCSFYQINPALLVWIVLAGVLMAFVTHAFLCWCKLPALTLQFVLLMLLAEVFGPASGLHRLPQLQTFGTCSSALLNYSFCVTGQISFISSVPLGMLVWTALTHQRWHLGAWALLGAFIAWCVLVLGTSLWPQAHIATQAAGMGVNCMLVMLGLSIYQRTWSLRFLGSGFSILLCLVFGRMALPYFTLPFVLATWTVLLLSRPRSDVESLLKPWRARV